MDRRCDSESGLPPEIVILSGGVRGLIASAVVEGLASVFVLAAAPNAERHSGAARIPVFVFALVLAPLLSFPKGNPLLSFQTDPLFACSLPDIEFAFRTVPPHKHSTACLEIPNKYKGFVTVATLATKMLYTAMDHGPQFEQQVKVSGFQNFSGTEWNLSS
jgi:hypothetical protein